YRRHRRAPRLPPAQPPSPAGPREALEFDLATRLGSFALHVRHHAATPNLALLGPSGAGKTLTLRLLAGVEAGKPVGHVRFGERELDALPPEQREVGYVPQGSALLPRRSVWR